MESDYFANRVDRLPGAMVLLPQLARALNKPAIDDRYHVSRIVSHSEASIDARPVRSAADVARLVSSETRVVGDSTTASRASVSCG